MKEVFRISHGGQRNGSLRDVNLDVYAGEIVAVQGLAGSGIRALMNVLEGRSGLDEGSIWVEEQPVPPRRNQESLWRNIFVSTAGRNQMPNLTLADNLEILHHPASYFRYYSAGKARERARRYFSQEGIQLEPQTRIDGLSPADQHVLNLMQARMQHARLVVMDDMRTEGAESWSQELLERMRRMREEGTSFLILCYHANPFQHLADRILTLSQGRDVFEQNRGEFADTSSPLFPYVSVAARVGAYGLLMPDAGAERLGEALRDFRARCPELWEREIRFSVPEGEQVTDGQTVLIPCDSAEKLCGNLSLRDNLILPLVRKAALTPLGYIRPRIAEAACRDCMEMMGLERSAARIGDLTWVQRKMLSIDRWRLTGIRTMVLHSPYFALDSREIDELQQYLIRLAGTGIRLIMAADSIHALASLCARIRRVPDGSAVSAEEKGDPQNLTTPA